MWIRYREINYNEVKKLYKQIRNKVKFDIKKLIQTEQQYIANNIKTNPKKFWQYINSKTKGSNKIGNTKYLNKIGAEMICDNDNDKCNAFIDYFTVYLHKKVNLMKRIYHLNLLILLCLILLLK